MDLPFRPSNLSPKEPEVPEPRPAARGRFPRATLIFILAVVGACAPAPAALGAAPRTTPKPSGPPIGVFGSSGYMEQVEAARRAYEREEAARRTPEARQNRTVSRTSYRDLSAAEALTVGRERLPEIVLADRLDPVRLKPGQRIARFLGDFAARLDNGPGEPTTVLQSTMPIAAENERGEKAPIDLRLADTGRGFAPANPLDETRLGDTAASALSLEDAGVSMNVPGAPAPGLEVKDKLFYANVGTGADTDLVLQPTPGGTQASFILRSEDSPETLQMELDVPEGAQARLFDPQAESSIAGGPPQPSSGVEVVRAGRRIVQIAPAFAYDDDNQPIPVRYELLGRRLSIHVDFRDKDVKFPITVDPYFTQPFRPANCWTVWARGWNYREAGWNGYAAVGRQGNQPFSFFCDGAVGPALYMQATTNPGYVEYDNMNWYWKAPPNTFITQAAFTTFGINVNSYLHEGIMQANHANWDDNPTVEFNSFPQWTYRWHCAGGPSCPFAPATTSENNEATSGMAMTGPSDWGRGMAPTLAINYGVFNVYDRNDPYISSYSLVPSTHQDGWFKANEIAGLASVSAGDIGLGVYQVAVARANGSLVAGAATGLFCSTVDGAYASQGEPPCPRNRTTSVGVNTNELTEGNNTLYAIARDVVDHVTPITGPGFTVKVDKTAPRLSISGPLRDGEDLNGDDSYPLIVQAYDDRSQTVSSGVQRIEIWVDGAHRRTTTQSSPCPDDGCPLDDFFDMGAAPGSHQIIVKVFDKAGNEASDTWNVVIGSGPPNTTADPTVDEMVLNAALEPYPADEDCEASAPAIDTTEPQQVVEGTWPGGTEKTEVFADGSYTVTRCGATGQLAIRQHVEAVEVPTGATQYLATETVEPAPGGGLVATSSVLPDADDPVFATDWQAHGADALAEVVSPTAGTNLPSPSPPEETESENPTMAAFPYESGCDTRNYARVRPPAVWPQVNNIAGPQFRVNNQSLPRARANARIIDGEQSWNTTYDACRQPLRHDFRARYQGFTTARANRYGDGQDVVDFGNLGDLGRCDLALACGKNFAIPVNGGWRMVESDIRFDGRNDGGRFYTGAGRDVPSGLFDLWGVAAHEWGHSAGLGHSPNPTQTMVSDLYAGVNNYRTLGLSDVVGVNNLYR
jgi:Matrixin